MTYVMDTVLPFYIYVLLLSICLPAADLVQAAALDEQSLDNAFLGEGSDRPLINSPEKRILADFESKVSFEICLRFMWEPGVRGNGRKDE